MNPLQLFFGFLAGVSVTALYFELRHRVRSMEERLKRLEEANQKRMNYRTMEGIENALLALDAEMRETELKRDFLDNAIAWLTKARNPQNVEK